MVWRFSQLPKMRGKKKKKKQHNELRCPPITKEVQVDMDGISLLSNRPLGIRWLLNFHLTLRLYDTEHCFIGCTFTYEIMNFLLYQFHLSPTIPPPIFSLLLLLLLSHFSCVQLCATPETAAQQAPQSLGFSRQEHWSGLPFPSPKQESEKLKWSRSVVSDS